MPQAFAVENGPVFRLGNKVGQGGEGAVFEIAETRDFVAKIYHQALSPERVQKLKTMVALKNERLTKIASWPVGTVVDQQSGRFSGIILPRIDGAKEIHQLYSPKSRLSEFPRADWLFLVHTAMNMAKCFQIVHDYGHIVGDVNHANILVDDNAWAFFIDCDSFQVRHNGSVFTCDVGISTHQPPEILSKGTFKGIVRSPDQDNFGLAVLIFQLLLLNRHPFSGVFSGQGDMSIERAIVERRYAYGPSALSRGMRPPPKALDVSIVTPELAGLFERAFCANVAAGESRPTAADWVGALSHLKSNLRRCSTVGSHWILAGHGSCPWCRLEGVIGQPLFPIFVQGQPPIATGAFDLQRVWAAIQAVTPPVALPTLESVRLQAVASMPSTSNSATLIQITFPSLSVPTEVRVRLQRAPAARSMRRFAIVAAILVMSTGFVVGSGAVIAGIAAGALALVIIANWASAGADLALVRQANHARSAIDQQALALRNQAGPLRARRVVVDAAATTARREWTAVEQIWLQETANKEFEDKLSHLERDRRELEGLPQAKEAKIRELRTEQRNRQLHHYLDRYRIRHARISGIGPERTTTLESFGVETAADVTAQAVLGVPGFGPALTQRLLAWRASLERRFVFNPNAPLDPRDLSLIDQAIAQTRQSLQRRLSAGANELRAISRTIGLRRQGLTERTRQAARAVAHVSAELQAFPSDRDLTARIEEERRKAHAALATEVSRIRQAMDKK
jgi:DNA-binding helix-hairpin-helix protein with protein kinase domain